MSKEGFSPMRGLIEMAKDPKVKDLLAGGETERDIIGVLNGRQSVDSSNKLAFDSLVTSIRNHFSENTEMLKEIDRILAGADNEGIKAVALQNLKIVKSN